MQQSASHADASEQLLCGHAAPDARPLRWARPALQWLAVGAAHAAVLGAVLHMSPQARQLLGDVVQATLIAPPAPPQVQPPAPPEEQPPPPKPQPRPKPRKSTLPTPPPQPAPLLTALPQVATPAPAYVVPALPTEPPPAAAAAPASPAAASLAAPAPLIPPVFSADYLDNPPPPYPQMSRRRGEQGRVLLRVFVSAAGRAERVEVKTSSGFERLDDAARAAVAGWRFVPARRGDEQVAAWVQIPIAFVM